MSSRNICGEVKTSKGVKFVELTGTEEQNALIRTIEDNINIHDMIAKKLNEDLSNPLVMALFNRCSTTLETERKIELKHKKEKIKNEVEA